MSQYAIQVMQPKILVFLIVGALVLIIMFAPTTTPVELFDVGPLTFVLVAFAILVSQFTQKNKQALSQHSTPRAPPA
jgi:hypothetical protein